MTRRTLALAAAIALIPCGVRAAAAQDQNTPRPKHDIVVTATRLETPERKVGSSLTVITGDELVRTGEPFVLDALEAVLGLATSRNGGPGAAASVSIRGAGSEHTLFLLDGLELNDPINPARSFDLAHLALSEVERIEVLRGPQGLLYGSDALGGVVNIITRTGRGRPRFVLASSADTLGTLAADASLAGSGDKSEYAFALFHEDTAGISAASSAYAGNVEKDGYRNLSLSARFGYTFRPETRLTLALRGVTARTELDNFGGPGGDDPNSRQNYATLQARAQLRDLARGGRWERILSLSWQGSRRDHLNPIDEAHPEDSEEGAYRSDLFKLDWQNNVFLSSTHTLTAGLELEDERGRSDYVAAGAWGTSVSSFPSVRAGSAGLYLLDHWETGDRFFVTAGVRAENHRLAGPALTFRVAPAFLIKATGTRLKASLGTGFKSPSLYQLFAPATSWGPVGNPDLRPERATGLRRGGRATPGRGPGRPRPDLVHKPPPRPGRFRLSGRLRQHRPGPPRRPRGLGRSPPVRGLPCRRGLHAPFGPRPRRGNGASAPAAGQVLGRRLGPPLRTLQPRRERPLGRPPARPRFQRLSLRDRRAPRLRPSRRRPLGLARLRPRALRPG